MRIAGLFCLHVVPARTGFLLLRLSWSFLSLRISPKLQTQTGLPDSAYLD
jgi:hypothetical protein